MANRQSTLNLKQCDKEYQFKVKSCKLQLGPTPETPPPPRTDPAPVVDVTAILDGLASKNPEKLDWRKSIVDLMKLVGMDSSFSARTELAKELHYTGSTSDSAAMNVWLHQEVIKKISENGGKVPPELLKS